LSICKLATSFDLQSHHQIILNRISVGILSGSAHVWDPKNLHCHCHTNMVQYGLMMT